MRALKAWILVALIAGIAAGLVYYERQSTDQIDRDPVVSVDRGNNESSGGGQSVFTFFKSPWQLPELKFINRKNREITLQAFRGSYVLLNVWATWCAPCREEMPALDRLQKKLGGPDFHVLPLSIDETHSGVIRKFYAEMKIEHLYVYHDPSGESFTSLNLPAIPATILLDREGRGLGYVVGPVKWDSDEIAAEIETYLSPGR